MPNGVGCDYSLKVVIAQTTIVATTQHATFFESGAQSHTGMDRFGPASLLAPSHHEPRERRA